MKDCAQSVELLKLTTDVHIASSDHSLSPTSYYAGAREPNSLSNSQRVYCPPPPVNLLIAAVSRLVFARSICKISLFSLHVSD